MRKKTHEEYLDEVTKINPNIDVLGIYINNKTKILHRCKIDGYIWQPVPAKILKGQGCPCCAGNIKKTHDQYVAEIKQINPNICVEEKYINDRTKILHRCTICGHLWKARPGDILHKHGCPVCAPSHRAIGAAPGYINSIWASAYKEYFNIYIWMIV